jgi:hypothetical protein
MVVKMDSEIVKPDAHTTMTAIDDHEGVREYECHDTRHNGLYTDKSSRQMGGIFKLMWPMSRSHRNVALMKSHLASTRAKHLNLSLVKLNNSHLYDPNCKERSSDLALAVKDRNRRQRRSETRSMEAFRETSWTTKLSRILFRRDR